MRYKVPQNIDMQDRIIGPLTMIQLIYAVIGGGLAYSAFMSLPKPLSIITAVPIAIFTFALIFIKVNERPFLDFFLSMVQFMSTPKQRVWHHGAYDNFRVVIFKTRKENKQIQEKHISHTQIEQAAKKSDQA